MKIHTVKNRSQILAIGLMLVLSSCLTTPAVDTGLIYVKADTGLDSNVGTLDKPFKTIKKALAVWKSGQALMLIPSIYNEVSGETWPYDAPAGLVIKSTASGVILQNETPDPSGNLKRVAFNVSNVQIENLAFKNFDRALVQNSGKQTLKGVTFEAGPSVSYATDMTKSAEADWSNVSFKGGSLLLKEASIMSIKGATFSAFEGTRINGSAQLNLENATTPDGLGGQIIDVRESAKVSIKNSSLTSNNLVLYADGNSKLDVSGTSISSTSSSGIRVGNGVTLIVQGGSIYSQTGYGIEVPQGSSANVSVDGTGITVGSGYSGISQSKGSLQVNNAQITSQGSNTEAIKIRGQVYFTLRNSTLTANSGYGTIYMDTNGEAISLGATDLGTAASPGNNTLKNTSSGALIYIRTGTGTTTSVSASGNTWLPSLQGADAQGKYAVGTSVVASSSSGGKNYIIYDGVTLKF